MNTASKFNKMLNTKSSGSAPSELSVPSVAEKEERRPRVHLDFLDGLRGLAATYVVCFHFLALNTAGLPNWARHAVSWSNFGHSAVNLFIVLSGFSLMLPVAYSQDKLLLGGTRLYLKRRTWRILPPYYVALGLSLVSLLASPQGMAALRGHAAANWSANFTAGTLLSHLAVIHNLRPEWAGRSNMALWSVATEWQIYFVFPLLLLPVWRRFGNVAAVVAGFGAGLLPLLVTHYDLSTACFWYIGLFALGMMGAVLCANRSRPNAGSLSSSSYPSCRKLLSLTLLLLLGYFAALKILPVHSLINAGYYRFYLGETVKDGLVGGLVLCLILYCVHGVNQRQENAPTPYILLVLESSVARTLGLFSYSLYLTHCIILQEADIVTDALHLSPVGALAFRTFVGLPAALAFAFAFHKLIEKPFMTRFQKKSEKALLS